MVGVIEAAAVIAVVGVIAVVTVTHPGGGTATSTASAAATRVTTPVADPPTASDPAPSGPSAAPSASLSVPPPVNASSGPAGSPSAARDRAAGARPAPPAPAPAGIDHDSFASVADLALNGSAHRSGTALELTSAVISQAGSAWSGTRIDPTRSFTTRFRLALLDGGADGVAFVVQSAGPGALGHNGYGIGYAGVAPSVVVEFDTYRNPWELNGNHVAVTANGVVDSCMVSRQPAFAMAGTGFTGWVDYRADTHTLAVAVGPGTVRPADLVSVTVDLAGVVGPGPAYVGFTAATGGRAARQQVLSWYLST
jgi:hypothetical protein